MAQGKITRSLGQSLAVERLRVHILAGHSSRGTFMNDAARRTVFGHFPYGLYAVTLAHGGEEHGMTATWVTQASFEPPMLVVAVENRSRMIGMMRDARHFVINV